MNHLTAVASLIAAASLAAGCSGSSANERSSVLVGAGSSLVYPLMSEWSPDYARRTGVTVTYGPIGSGGGIAQVTARTVDFGASEAPLTAGQKAAAKGVLQLPWALAATLVAYRVKGVENELRLSGPVLARIYLGQITAWDDPAIAALNPGVTLPSTRIVPVFRKDPSGDTYAFTDFLSRTSPEWRRRVGTGAAVTFPEGSGAAGNSGIGGALTRIDGAIAYLAFAYVVENGFDHALVENRAGAFPHPDLASIAAAAQAVGAVPPDGAVSLVDPPASAPDAYPLSTYSYALVPERTSQAARLRAFLTYAIGPGQRYGPAFRFAPLPAQVLRADERTIARIHP